MQLTVSGYIQENYIMLIILAGVSIALVSDWRMRWSKIEAVFPFIAIGVFVLSIVRYIESYFGFLPYQNIGRNIMSAVSYGLYPALILMLVYPITPNWFPRWILIIPELLNGIHSVLVLFNSPLSVYFTSDNHFQRGPLGNIPFISSYLYLLLLVIFSIRYFRERNQTGRNIFIFIAVSIVVTNILEKNDIVYALDSVISFDILLYCMYLTITGRVMAENERLKTEMQLYHSRIQPHFIYNSLSMIRSLITKDTEAKEALDQFTRFLRGSVDMLAEEECVRAEREFDTVESYLYMERRRFGDKLTIHTDLQDKGFLVPAFSVQVLVENAIKHGIRRTKDGSGTLTVRSFETEGEHMIEVVDDGAGFDVGALSEQSDNSGFKHIGLDNLKKRLELMCDGSLEIESTIGEGTIVRVHIPKNI